MKILYGIQGTGNGHLSRARALAPELRQAGFDIDFIFSGRAAEDFFNMEVFGHKYQVFKGLSLVTEAGQLKLVKTARKNDILRFIRDIKKLDLSHYDLVISDFEPVTAWAAKLQGVNSIGISHQCAFDFSIPKAKGYCLSRTVMKLFAPTKQRVGLHWHHFNHPILPPLIERLNHKTVKKNKILIYMGFEETAHIVEFISGFTDYNFIIYAKVADTRTLANITIKPLSHKEFHIDLADCNGVISNAGFELASECLQLGKKSLIKPLKNQFEQESNAVGLEALKRATIIESLDKKVLEQWLNQTSPAAINYPNVAASLAAWLKSQIENSDNTQTLESLANELWKLSRHLPDYP